MGTREPRSPVASTSDTAATEGDLPVFVIATTERGLELRLRPQAPTLLI